MNFLNTLLLFTLFLFLNKNFRKISRNFFSYNFFLKSNKLIIFLISFNIVLLIGFSGKYLFSNIYLDHVEPQVAIVSWFFEYKKDIYNSTSDYERYSLIFGPITYYANYLIMKIFGPSILTSKIISYLFINLTLFLTFLNSYKITKKIGFSFFVTGLMSMFFLSTVAAVLRISNDSLVYFLISLSIYFCLSNYSLKNIFLFSIVCIFILNIKPNLIIGVLPSAYYIFTRSPKKIRDIIIFFIIALVSLYFIWSYQNLSYINYFHWIQIISEFEYSNGFNFDIFLKNLSFSLLWIIPLSILYKLDWIKIKTYEKNFYIILIFSSLALSIIGSRQGAGSAELFALIPPALFLFCKSYKRGNYYINKKNFSFNYYYTVILICVFFHSSTKGLYKKIEFLNKHNYSNEIIELKKILSDFPDKKINMGYGSNYKSYLISYLRPILTFDRNNFVLDVPHLIETVDKIPINSTFLENCNDEIYVFVKNDKHFFSKYWNKTIFNETFIKKFYENFEKTKQYNFFEIWNCNK